MPTGGPFGPGNKDTLGPGQKMARSAQGSNQPAIFCPDRRAPYLPGPKGPPVGMGPWSYFK